MTRAALLLTIAAVIGTAVAVVDYRSAGVDPSPPRDPSPPLTISAPGLVEGASKNVDLRPETAGVVAQRYVDVNDWVEAGDPLLRLDDRTAGFDARAAEAALASARAQLDRLVNGARSQERDEAQALRDATAVRLDQARTTLSRLTQLERQSVVAEQEADDARSKVDALAAELAAAEARLALLEAPARDDERRLAEARVAAAEARLEAARVAVEKTVLRAPRSGRVLDVDAQVGELISPTHPPVVTLADTSQLRVRVFVEELDAPRVAVGATATVTADGLPGQTFPGRVATVSPRMEVKQLFTGQPNELYDTKVREVLVNLEAPANPDSVGLIVGLRVDARLSAAGADPAP